MSCDECESATKRMMLWGVAGGLLVGAAAVFLLFGVKR